MGEARTLAPEVQPIRPNLRAVAMPDFAFPEVAETVYGRQRNDIGHGTELTRCGLRAADFHAPVSVPAILQHPEASRVTGWRAPSSNGTILRAVRDGEGWCGSQFREVPRQGRHEGGTLV